jgi:hypothetical protein
MALRRLFIAVLVGLAIQQFFERRMLVAARRPRFRWFILLRRARAIAWLLFWSIMGIYFFPSPTGSGLYLAVAWLLLLSAAAWDVLQLPRALSASDNAASFLRYQVRNGERSAILPPQKRRRHPNRRPRLPYARTLRPLLRRFQGNGHRPPHLQWHRRYIFSATAPFAKLDSQAIAPLAS